MAAKSHYLDNAILDHILRNTALTSPTSVYIGLFTVAPTPSTAGTEVTGGSYARVAAGPGTWGAPALGVITNTGVYTFPTASVSWGLVVAAGVFDQASGGNLLYFGTLASSKTVDPGDTASFAASALTITEQ